MFGVRFVTSKYDSLKKKTVETTNETLEAVFKIALLFLSVFTIIWISIFLYVAFYYTYVPSIEHVKSINLEFVACDGNVSRETNSAVCSFPRAHVLLTKSNQLLMVGQPYKITVTLEVPESDQNRSLGGMFLVCGQLYSKKGLGIAHSCRSTMLRYRSPFLKMIRTIALSGLYILNYLEEKQILEIELFSNFEEDQNYPVTDMHVEVKSELVQVYSSKVKIDAHLTGLRYLMFHWPTTSAALGISFNIVVILFVVLLSWWQLYGPYSLTGREFLYKKLKETYKSKLTAGGIGDEIIASLDDCVANGGIVHEVTSCTIIEENEEDEGAGYVKLSDFYDNEEDERKFIIERKSSSSEA